MNEDVKTLVYTLLHQRLVQENMLKITHELERRASNHDNSKISFDEFEGLVEINYIAREKGFGSPEYQDSLKSDMIKHHWEWNDHHPEYYRNGILEMGLFQIVEMVCDWRAVCIQKKLDWEAMLIEQNKRFKFTPEQEYLIRLISEELI